MNLTIPDVFIGDIHMFVTVAAALLMVEAQSMEELMLYHLFVDTPRAVQRQDLLSSSSAHRGVAPRGPIDYKYNMDQLCEDI